MLRLVMTCAIAACATPVTRAPIAPPDPRAWTTLQRELAGRWIATTGDAQVPVEFRLMANQTVVLELFGGNGGKTVTTYHQDGAGVLATHYCAQGNQPRLRLRGGDGDKLVFVLADATGQDAGESMLVELSIQPIAPRGFERVEVYRQADGKLDRTIWRYTPAP